MLAFCFTADIGFLILGFVFLFLSGLCFRQEMPKIELMNIYLEVQPYCTRCYAFHNFSLMITQKVRKIFLVYFRSVNSQPQ